MEEWKWVVGYVDAYRISESGKVTSLKHRGEKERRVSLSPNGYRKIVLLQDGKPKSYSIHRLVATAFIPNPENKPQVNHKDGNKLNNHYTNLEWSTAKENINHAYDTGLHINHFGQTHYRTSLTENDVIAIRNKNDLGISAKNLASQYGVSRNTILCILRGHSWKHLPVGRYREIFRPKLSDEQRREIIARKNSGESRAEIVSSMGISYGQIAHLLNPRFSYKIATLK